VGERGKSLFKWLRRRREAARRNAEDAERLRKRNDDGESAPNPDPLEELVRIVGETHVDDPPRHAAVSARRSVERRSRPHRRA
jgi:hypothetical protein